MRTLWGMPKVHRYTQAVCWKLATLKSTQNNLFWSFMCLETAVPLAIFLGGYNLWQFFGGERLGEQQSFRGMRVAKG
jgi:hypothetical protein